MLAGEKCGECRFYIEKQEKVGECRRYAPRPNVLKINWCKVSSDHWCGEFEEKAPEGPTTGHEHTE